MREKGKGCDWWWDEGGEGRLGSVIFFYVTNFGEDGRMICNREDEK